MGLAFYSLKGHGGLHHAAYDQSAHELKLCLKIHFLDPPAVELGQLDRRTVACGRLSWLTRGCAISSWCYVRSVKLV